MRAFVRLLMSKILRVTKYTKSNGCQLFWSIKTFKINSPIYAWRRKRVESYLPVPVLGLRGFGNISPYASSKGAIESLAKCLEIENQDYGITFHIMHPPLTNTASSSELPYPKNLWPMLKK